MKKAKDETPSRREPFLELHPLIKGAIRDAMTRALRAKPRILCSKLEEVEVYEIDGDLCSLESAIDEIMCDYSWWK